VARRRHRRPQNWITGITRRRSCDEAVAPQPARYTPARSGAKPAAARQVIAGAPPTPVNCAGFHHPQKPNHRPPAKAGPSASTRERGTDRHATSRRVGTAACRAGPPSSFGASAPALDAANGRRRRTDVVAALPAARRPCAPQSATAAVSRVAAGLSARQGTQGAETCKRLAVELRTRFRHCQKRRGRAIPRA
jgi:hypothetical protein